MDKQLNTYLYYNCDPSETDTWDFKFAYFLGTVVNQVTALNQKLFCNFDIPGTTYLEPEKVDISTIHAIIFIQTATKNIASAFEKINKYIDFNDEAIKNKTFVVLRHPILQKASKSVFVSFQCYHFFELNQRTLQFMEYSPDIPGESENGYWAVLSDLAYDIKFITLTSGYGKPDRNNTIFLAEVSNDQMKNRERIKRELLFSGFKVLPIHPLPGKLEEFEKRVKDLMSQSILSIHILGEFYGESPEGTDYSYTELQNRIYTKYYSEHKTTSDTKLFRIIWLPPSLDSFDEKQMQYLQRIKKEIVSSENTEMVQSTIFDLKEIIEKKIKRSLKKVPGVSKDETNAEVLLIFFKMDEVIHLETISVFNKNAISYQVFNIESTGLDNITVLMTLLKHRKNIVIINNSKNTSQLTSFLSLIVRSKGYAEALPVSSVGLFLTSGTNTNYDYLPVDLQMIYFEKNNLQEKMESYLSNIKI